MRVESSAKGVPALHWPLHSDGGEFFSTKQLLWTHFRTSFDMKQNQQWYTKKSSLTLQVHNNLGNLLPTTMSPSEI